MSNQNPLNTLVKNSTDKYSCNRLKLISNLSLIATFILICYYWLARSRWLNSPLPEIGNDVFSRLIFLGVILSVALPLISGLSYFLHYLSNKDDVLKLNYAKSLTFKGIVAFFVIIASMVSGVFLLPH